MSDHKPFILIADDEESYGNIFKLKLSKEGYNTAVVSNGEWALQVAKRKKPDLILLDLLMPKMDGFETLKHLREDANLKDVPVIVLSNLDRSGHIERLEPYGIKAYLIKIECSIQDIVNTIKQFV